MGKRPKVALLIESSRSYGRGLLRGIASYAHLHTNWSIVHQELSSDAITPEWLHNSNVEGILARIENPATIQIIEQLGVPTVDLRCLFDIDRVPKVETDDEQVAQLAFDHLVDRGFRRFAFCGFESANYSVRRRDFFRSIAETHGYPLTVYESPSQKMCNTAQIEIAGLFDTESLRRWLETLQPPTGLFVCNDIRGQQVLDQCREAEISVPEDVGVIGVDDDDVICPLCDPPMTSVQPDTHRVGFMAAEILAEMMHGKSIDSSTAYVAPLGVVERLSTQVVATDDREVAKACRFIRQYACDGIDVADVAQATSLSRRQLERRFRMALDRTPADEITKHKIARAQQLLRETDLSLEKIADRAGYSHTESLCTAFRREAQETPNTYRKRNRRRLESDG